MGFEPTTDILQARCAFHCTTSHMNSHRPRRNVWQWWQCSAPFKNTLIIVLSCWVQHSFSAMFINIKVYKSTTKCVFKLNITIQLIGLHTFRCRSPRVQPQTFQSSYFSQCMFWPEVTLEQTLNACVTMEIWSVFTADHIWTVIG